MQRMAVTGGEDEVAVVLGDATRRLGDAASAKHCQRIFVQRDAPSLLGLRWREFSRAADQGVPDLEPAVVEIDVLPPECEQLALTHPRRHGEAVQDLQSVATGGL
jgi:hypothetical protein